MSVALAFALALAGYAAGWLTVDGTLAAGLVGGTVFAGSGPTGGLLLGLFFVSGSALSAFTGSSSVIPATSGRSSGGMAAGGSRG